jgi:ABC-type bacteriocin/lantibiotic exporter with double-glycine peptidase domain
MLRALQEMSLGVPALENVQALQALAPLPDHPGNVPPVDWAVRLRHVRCEIEGRVMLGPVDLDLAPGRVCVVSGANGAGKTTLLRLLLGLVPPRSGEFSVDGLSWVDVDLAAYRQGLAYLPQHSMLIPGTVLDNLRYTAPDATPEAAWQALAAVGLVSRLGAGGLDLRLGPGGSPLSGGERQRLALARLWLRPARLLVLDEPTNHLDAAAVKALAALLRHWPGAPGVLVVSHDPALLALADVRYRLVHGRLIVG